MAGAVNIRAISFCWRLVSLAVVRTFPGCLTRLCCFGLDVEAERYCTAPPAARFEVALSHPASLVSGAWNDLSARVADDIKCCRGSALVRGLDWPTSAQLATEGGVAGGLASAGTFVPEALSGNKRTTSNSIASCSPRHSVTPHEAIYDIYCPWPGSWNSRTLHD